MYTLCETTSESCVGQINKFIQEHTATDAAGLADAVCVCVCLYVKKTSNIPVLI